MFWLLCLPFHITIAQDASYKTQITAVLGSDVSDGPVELSDKTIYASRITRQMYHAREFKLIWDDAAIASLSMVLGSLEQDGLVADDYRFAQIDAQLLAPDRANLTPEELVELDILLNEAFMRAVYNLHYGKADAERLDPDINFVRTYEGEDPTRVLLEYITQARIDDAFDWARPKSEGYQWLKAGLARYRGYQAAGGWTSIPAGETLRPAKPSGRGAPTHGSGWCGPA